VALLLLFVTVFCTVYCSVALLLLFVTVFCTMYCPVALLLLFVTVFRMCMVLLNFLYFTVSACDIRAATLTEVYPWVFLSCKANARI
jgi:hypothetical protein